jgi:8-oxo-dGTP pyrophosphatase MutT (NUDIX family)
MPRKYEVHIDGKTLIVGKPPKMSAIPLNWLALRVEHAGDMQRLVGVLGDKPELVGAYAFGEEVDALWAWFKESYHLVQAAGGAVTDADGRLLAIHRLGRWDLPKGKVERGEDIEAAALREVQEECGLRRLRIVKPLLQTWHTYDRHGPQLKCTHWFLMEGDAAEPLTAQTEEDIDAVRWMDADGRAEMRRDTYGSILSVLNAWEAEHLGPAGGAVRHRP